MIGPTFAVLTSMAAPIRFSILKAVYLGLALGFVTLFDNPAQARLGDLFCTEQLTKIAETVSASKDPYDLALSGVDIRTHILSRRRFDNDIDFLVPEFKSLLNEMLVQLNSIQLRNESISTRNPLRIFRNQISLPTRIALLKSNVHKALGGNLRYWQSIELSLDFALIVDNINLLEKTDTYIDNRHVQETMKLDVRQLKLIAQNYPVLIVPTFRNLSTKDINRTWGKGIAPIGLVTKMTEADFNRFGGRGFIRHDIQHLRQLVSGLHYLATNTYNADFTLDDKEKASIAAALLKNSEHTVHFFRIVDQLHEPFKSVIEDTFFEYDHERDIFENFLNRVHQKSWAHTRTDFLRNEAARWTLQTWTNGIPRPIVDDSNLFE